MRKPERDEQVEPIIELGGVTEATKTFSLPYHLTDGGTISPNLYYKWVGLPYPPF